MMPRYLPYITRTPYQDDRLSDGISGVHRRPKTEGYLHKVKGGWLTPADP